MDRNIILWDEINDEGYAKFAKKMRNFFLENAKTAVHIELCSPGGDAYSALAYAALIRRMPFDVIVTATGLVASAAVIILAYGTKRRMAEEAWVMVHEDSGETEGNVSAQEVEIKHSRALEYQWAGLLAKSTTTSAKKWTAMHKATTYLNAQQCLELGLVDVII